jgi:hypothetical protein
MRTAVRNKRYLTRAKSALQKTRHHACANTHTHPHARTHKHKTTSFTHRTLMSPTCFDTPYVPSSGSLLSSKLTPSRRTVAQSVGNNTVINFTRITISDKTRECPQHRHQSTKRDVPSSTVHTASEGCTVFTGR